VQRTSEWYEHHQPNVVESVEPLIRKAAIDMSTPEKPFGFVGTVAPWE
jgi:hypothetical protein